MGEQSTAPLRERRCAGNGPGSDGSARHGRARLCLRGVRRAGGVGRERIRRPTRALIWLRTVSDGSRCAFPRSAEIGGGTSTAWEMGPDQKLT